MPTTDQAYGPALDGWRHPNDDPNLPLMWEDEDVEMGESYAHNITDEILRLGLKALLKEQPDLAAFANMNMYFDHEDDDAEAPPYVSPDLMVVRLAPPVPLRLKSYRIGKHGPAPLLVGEIMSEKSFQQGDLSSKVELYAKLGIAEYLLIDVTGQYLRERLQLRTLQPDGTWAVSQDADGGITSRLGFRLVIEDDDLPRYLNTKTGRRIARPDEAEDEADARRAAEERAAMSEQRTRDLEAELERLRNAKT